MEKELTRVIRRLAVAAWRVTNEHDESVVRQPGEITDDYLKFTGDWKKAEAIYKELIKIDTERQP